jgi:hypothetical protein
MSLYNVGDRLVCRFGWNKVPPKPAYQTVIYIVFARFINTIFLLRMSTGLLETCRGFKLTYYVRKCASSWLPTRITASCYLLNENNILCECALCLRVCICLDSSDDTCMITTNFIFFLFWAIANILKLFPGIISVTENNCDNGSLPSSPKIVGLINFKRTTSS